ncbi:hypothetical protein A5707_07365 [Mycobacterium kyorinense]|uniref:DUF7159 domain-containing protein n=1 Tax=Mycobacterium kyorinense TaxID=487514 RepID=A0A1A2YWA0_9MYCO|nr:hypothetical protein [Mycobacterium kyorinense]OBI41527.1 hypothetical protein A5707_07365 [Mycobacterium kyorinense]
METVLGLSLTSTAVGWVLVDGRDADGTILDHDGFDVHTGGGTRAADLAERVSAAVSEVVSAATEWDRRLHVLGVTWSDDASAEAAVLLEALTDAGFDNVVPIRSVQAAEMLAQGIAPVVGYQKAAVCLVDGESTTVVMVDAGDGRAQTAVKHLDGGADRLARWLTTMFERSTWQPDGVIVVGADHVVDALSWQLDEALPVPVFTQSGVAPALARGAALAAADATQFADSPIPEPIDTPTPRPVRSRPPAYAGALTMLVAGAATFVASVSLAIGPRLLPDRPTEPVRQAVHKAAPAPVAQAPAPPPARVEAPPVHAAPEPAPPEEPVVVAAPVEPQNGFTAEPSTDLPVAAAAPPPPPEPLPPPPPPEPNPHPLLTRVLERLHGHHDDAPPDEPAPAPIPSP